MIHAKDRDFEKIKAIFKQHKEWFPHLRQDYIKRMIASGNLILDSDVIITYNYYKRKQRIGGVQAQQGDCILHQIAAKYTNGSASKTLQNFFKWTNRRVFLTVRSSNAVAKKFYEKNGMKLVSHTSWLNGTIPGDVYMYDNVKEVLYE